MTDLLLRVPRPPYGDPRLFSPSTERINESKGLQWRPAKPRAVRPIPGQGFLMTSTNSTMEVYIPDDVEKTPVYDDLLSEVEDAWDEHRRIVRLLHAIRGLSRA